MTQHETWTIPPGAAISDGSGGSQKPLVVVGTPAVDDTIVWNGTLWVPAAPSGDTVVYNHTTDGIETSWGPISLPTNRTHATVALALALPALAADESVRLRVRFNNATGAHSYLGGDEGFDALGQSGICCTMALSGATTARFASFLVDVPWYRAGGKVTAFCRGVLVSSSVGDGESLGSSAGALIAAPPATSITLEVLTLQGDFSTVVPLAPLSGSRIELRAK
jgi:hypothetical protein